MKSAVFAPCVTVFCVGVLVGCGGGGYGGDGDAPPRASAAISIEPATITLGDSATISWNSNGGSCTASGAWSGPKPASGTQSVMPAEAGTFTYTLTCAGGGYGESEVASTTLTVDAATGFTQTVLVSKFAGTAAWRVDAHLLSPSGIAVAASGPVRVANRTTSTVYDGNGKAQAIPRALASGVPASTSGIAVGPTGIVANATSDFIIHGNGKAAPAEFIYASKRGVIGGWSSAVVLTDVVVMYADAGGAAYTGVAVAGLGRSNFLYAADFHNNKIDVFDARFAKQTRSAARFAFSDPTLPAGYAPFGIRTIRNGSAAATRVYVTYARRTASDDHAVGAGLGLVNVFDTDGRFLRRLVAAGGALNAPWGLALAPADFGTLGNALLIGNSGDGRINAFEPASGRFIGTLGDADGRPVAIPGLWGIAFGNDSNDQPHDTLFFVASTDDADGIYGRIDPSTTVH